MRHFLLALLLALSFASFCSDTTKVQIQGRAFKFPVPEGYIDYYKIDTVAIQTVAHTVKKNIKPVLCYITSSNLVKIAALDSLFFEKFFLLYYTKGYMATPYDDTRFSRILDTVCSFNLRSMSPYIEAKIDSLWRKHYDANGITAEHEDLNYCRSKEKCWAYKVAISNLTTSQNSWVDIQGVGFIKINNRVFNFLFQDKLDKTTTLAAFTKELDNILALIYSSSKFTGKDFFDLGLDNILDKNYSSALTNLNKAIELNPKLSEAYYQRAFVKLTLKDSQGAVKDYDKYISMDPNFYEAYYNRGLAYVDLGNTSNALLDFNKAIKLNPKHDLSYYFRAIIKSYLKDTNGGCSDFDMAIKLGYSDAKETKAKFCH